MEGVAVDIMVEIAKRGNFKFFPWNMYLNGRSWGEGLIGEACPKMYSGRNSLRAWASDVFQINRHQSSQKFQKRRVRAVRSQTNNQVCFF